MFYFLCNRSVGYTNIYKQNSMFGAYILSLNAQLTIGEPSGTSSAIVFWIVYVAVTWCIFSRVEYSLLLGEVLSRYQAIYVLVWGVVLAVASAYQAAFEYEAGGLYASESLYNMHIICSMVFNSTAFVVVVLLDAMPSLTHVTKAGALLLFLANASRIWITDRILLSYPLRPQVKLYLGVRNVFAPIICS